MGDAGPRRRCELDADLPCRGGDSGVEGLDELATVQRAAGLLISAGHDPAAAHETLCAGAADRRLSTYAWAVRLLDEHQAGRRATSECRPLASRRTTKGPTVTSDGAGRGAALERPA